MCQQTTPVKSLPFICADHANQFIRILESDIFYAWRMEKEPDGVHRVYFWRIFL